MPVVLTLSLALNLAVVAAMSGAVWRHKGAKDGPRAARGGAIYMQALPRDVRRDLYRQLRASIPPQGGTEDMLVVLRQEPFDPVAAARVLSEERDGALLRQDAASVAWLEQITSMSAQERKAYADRLQEITQRRMERRQRHES